MTYGLPAVMVERFPLEDPNEIKDEKLRAVMDTWTKLSQENGGVPVWHVDFGLAVPSVMSHAVVVDTSGEEAIYTLIGEMIRRFMGTERSHGPMRELIPEDNAKDVLHRLNKTAELRAPHYCLKTMSWHDGCDTVQYEALYLPFVKPEAEIPTWFFVCIAFDGDGLERVILPSLDEGIRT